MDISNSIISYAKLGVCDSRSLLLRIGWEVTRTVIRWKHPPLLFHYQKHADSFSQLRDTNLLYHQHNLPIIIMSDDGETIDLFDDPEEQFPAPLPPTEQAPIVSVPKQSNPAPPAPPVPPKQEPIFKEIALKKQPQDLKVDESQQINLSDSFGDLNQPKLKESYDNVGMSVYMQSQEPKINQLKVTPPATYPTSLPPTPPKPSLSKNSNSGSEKNESQKNTNLLNLSINKSLNEKSSPNPKSFFTKKKECSQTSSSGGNKMNLDDSTFGFDVPTTNKLLPTGNRSLQSSAHSSQSSENTPSIKTPTRIVDKIEISSNSNQVTFHINNSTPIKKLVTESYLQYLQKYFFYHFNIALPTHASEIIDNSSGSKAYIAIYFDFIKTKYSTHLIQFLEKSNYKQQEEKPQTKEVNKEYLKQKFEQYKNVVINTVKRMKGETLTSVGLLQRILSRQMEIAEKQRSAREKLLGVTGVNQISPSVYEKGGSQMNNYVVMTLRWLLGFQQTIQLIKERESKADQVELQKLESLLTEFTIEKQKQQRQKMRVLEEKIRAIYIQ